MITVQFTGTEAEALSDFTFGVDYDIEALCSASNKFTAEVDEAA